MTPNQKVAKRRNEIISGAAFGPGGFFSLGAPDQALGCVWASASGSWRVAVIGRPILRKFCG